MYKFWWKKKSFLNHEIFLKGKQKNILFLALNISIYNIEYINVIKQEFLWIFASIILQLNCTSCQ